jgi:hypothetical protein
LAEHHDTIEDAIRREKILKTWKRAWKIELIEASNPQWRDLWKIWQEPEKREIPAFAGMTFWGRSHRLHDNRVAVHKKHLKSECDAPICCTAASKEQVRGRSIASGSD